MHGEMLGEVQYPWQCVKALHKEIALREMVAHVEATGGNLGEKIDLAGQKRSFVFPNRRVSVNVGYLNRGLPGSRGGGAFWPAITSGSPAILFCDLADLPHFVGISGHASSQNFFRPSSNMGNRCQPKRSRVIVCFLYEANDSKAVIEYPHLGKTGVRVSTRLGLTSMMLFLSRDRSYLRSGAPRGMIRG